jgi:hypothetical protein
LHIARRRNAGSDSIMVYLFIFLLLVVIANIAGPIRRHKDIDQEMREMEYEHRSAVYGDGD